MTYYQAILQYDGSDRQGFQHQEGLSTIQGDLNHALAQLLQHPFTTRGASRTDKGVHAFAQVVKISAEGPASIDAPQLNTVLPPDIRCLELSPCPADFIPSMDQRSKEYLYLFSNGPSFDHRYIAQASSALNIDHIQTCVKMLTGKNDFKNFWSIGGHADTTVRHITECDLKQIDPRELFAGTLFNAIEVTSCWQFRIVGTGFLKHMVRHMVGALWAVGSGELSVEEFSELLHGDQKQQRPWKKADPRGLFLLKVSY